MTSASNDPEPVAIPRRERFEAYYAAGSPPWEIGRPQAAFLGIADRIVGRVLDVGCGTGELAMWLAARGRTVTGIDCLETPIREARRRSIERGVEVTFLQMDALAVGQLPERFDVVTDCGLFHAFDDTDRVRYVVALRDLLEPGAKAFILCMSDAEPGEHGPRRVSQRELRAAFADGFVVESIESVRFETISGSHGLEFSPGGAHALLGCIRRIRKTGSS